VYYIPPCEQTLVENSRSATVLDGCRIVPAYVLLALLKHLVPLRSLAKWTWCETTGPRDRLAERRLAANLLRLKKLLRLQRNLLSHRLLSAVGADPELVVGFRDEDGKSYAWVLVDEVSLVEPVRSGSVFASSRFGARGALLSQVRADCEPKTLAR
jgi:hypothetical protein